MSGGVNEWVVLSLELINTLIIEVSRVHYEAATLSAADLLDVITAVFVCVKSILFTHNDTTTTAFTLVNTDPIL